MSQCNIMEDSTSKERLKFVFFFQNYLFQPLFWLQMCITPILVGLIVFLVIKGRLQLLMVPHMFLCYSVAFLLGIRNIKRRLKFFSKNYGKFSSLANLQEKWLKLKSAKKIFSSEVFVSPKYVFYRDYKFWTSGEALIALSFFVLYSVPVFLPIALFFKIFAEQEYFVLYVPLLLYTTNSFFAFSGFIFWEKRLKKQVEKGEVTIMAY